MIFFGILGLDDMATEAGRGSSHWTRQEYDGVATDLRKFMKVKADPTARRGILKSLIPHLGIILDPKANSGLPNLARECNAARNQCDNIECALDNAKNGYSRNPFKRISERHIDDIALAVVCYLLRGYSAFFCRPRADRDFNAAKAALNDFHQAYLLAWRLYHSSKWSHYHSPVNGLTPFLNEAQNAHTINRAPGRSAYFIWYALVLSEIMRANVYRQVGYIKMADRHYRRAETRFNQLCGTMGGRSRISSHSHFREIVTPTLLQSFFERSKTRFDLGYFLEALILQLTCISYLVDLWQYTALYRRHLLQCNKFDPSTDHSAIQSLESNTILGAIQETIVFLNTERTLPIYDREAVTARFNLLARRTSPNPALDIVPIEPKSIISYIQYEHAQFACEVFARVGFILYLLRPRIIARRIWSDDDVKSHNAITRDHTERLEDYFAFETRWNDGKPDKFQIVSSHLGIYWRTLLNKSEEVEDGLFQNDIERKFALILRGKIPKRRTEGCRLTRSGFYSSVFATTTQNIVNIATVPRRNRRVLMRRGYKHRRTKGDLRAKCVAAGILDDKSSSSGDVYPPNKFVVLRRWQSFNPKIPGRRGHRLRGGGYFLLWQGKGIVIDPGYDFIQNFYDEGFSLEDIDAIIITHSHPDHDDDFASLTTLIKEWNEYHRKIGRHDKEKRIDLFLNESSHWKYASWLQASDVRIGRVISLPTLCWDKDSTQPSHGPIRGRGPRLDLRNPCPNGRDIEGADPYHIIIETVPAWHDDVIGKTAAIGLKFHLYTPTGRKAGILGYTGDTGAYGLEICKRRVSEDKWRIDRQFSNCDILIAHLGDIRIRELATAMDWHTVKAIDTHPFAQLFKQWFSPKDVKDVKTAKNATNVKNGKNAKKAKDAANRLMRIKIHEFLDNANTIDIIPSQALNAIIPIKDRPQEVHQWLNKYIKGNITEDDEFDCAEAGKILIDMFKTISNRNDRQNAPFIRELQATWKTLETITSEPIDQQALSLVLFLVAGAMLPWQYKYHLGIFGIYELFKTMVEYDKNFAHKNRIFVVGELPEELTSYRHMVAHWLNMTDVNWRGGKKRVHAFTGDIGLHIGLHRKHTRLEPQIRCTYCNYNNETVCRQENYQYPKDILETPIKRQQSALIYLCTKKDHHPACPNQPKHFLGSPYLRVI